MKKRLLLLPLGLIALSAAAYFRQASLPPPGPPLAPPGAVEAEQRAFDGVMAAEGRLAHYPPGEARRDRLSNQALRRQEAEIRRRLALYDWKMRHPQAP